MSKEIPFDAGRVWWGALCDFGNGLHEHCAIAKKDQLRFQTKRLYDSLLKRIKAEWAGRDEWRLMFACYEFVTHLKRDFGIGEACRLHGEEMEARGLRSPRAFCSVPFSRLDDKHANEYLDFYCKELRARVCSLTWWMEAQESLTLWLVFKELPQAWRGDRDKSAQAIAAAYLSKLPEPGSLLLQQEHAEKGVLDGAYLAAGAAFCDQSRGQAVGRQTMVKHPGEGGAVD